MYVALPTSRGRPLFTRSIASGATAIASTMIAFGMFAAGTPLAVGLALISTRSFEPKTRAVRLVVGVN